MLENLFKTDAIRGREADFFSGREALIENALRALKKRTQTCIIYGERGVGKTSLAWQILTTLEGSNERFSHIARAAGVDCSCFVPVPIKNLEAPRDVPDLLMQAIAPSQEPRSLYKQLPSLYQDEELISYVKRVYGLNIHSFEHLSDFSKRGEIMVRLFTDVMRKAGDHYPGKDIIFFVDEADLMKNKVGLGKLLKNTNHARFILVGIGDTMVELIDEHESSVRKVIGGVLEVKPLESLQIIGIFKYVEKIAPIEVRFSDAFLDLVVQYSGGFPWIAQHVGDQALSTISARSFADSAANQRKETYIEPIWVDAADFRPALEIVREAYSDLIDFNVAYGSVRESDVQIEVASSILKMDRYCTIDEINSDTGIAYGTLEIAIRRLIDSGILIMRPNKTYRFRDPIVRSFIMEEIGYLK